MQTDLFDITREDLALVVLFLAHHWYIWLILVSALTLPMLFWGDWIDRMARMSPRFENAVAFGLKAIIVVNIVLMVVSIMVIVFSIPVGGALGETLNQIPHP